MTAGDRVVLGKYLLAVCIADSGKTTKWEIYSTSKGNILGEVKWYGPWRQYTFWPAYGTIFNSACLDDMTAFLKELMEERKKYQGYVTSS